ncbi:MAG TPA: inositol 2-dehydrogenase [Trueperaceae bacterium]|nr:inositol 2-dehydrogenase [Trueperaceae bacterium]
MDRVGVALLGAGRMGRIHAETLPSIPGVRVVAVADPIEAAREGARVSAGALRAYADPAEAIHDRDVDAVVIATPTPTHAPLVEEAARAGKAVFCEKPVADSVDRARSLLARVREAGIPFQIGFQRRFDPGYAEMRERISRGEVGSIDQFRSVGRDPAPPPLEYLRISGGIFFDQALHEFDIARFLVGEVVEVSAWGTVRVQQEIGDMGDADTTVTLLRFASGALGVIENSRRAVYGYDVRTEVFGSGGKLVVDAVPRTPLWRYGEGGVSADHYYFFTDRFREAARLELRAFVSSVLEGRPPAPGADDALRAMLVAQAATESFRTGHPVSVEVTA